MNFFLNNEGFEEVRVPFVGKLFTLEERLPDASEFAINLITLCMNYDTDLRHTAKQLLLNPYFTRDDFSKKNVKKSTKEMDSIQSKRKRNKKVYIFFIKKLFEEYSKQKEFERTEQTKLINSFKLLNDNILMPKLPSNFSKTNSPFNSPIKKYGYPDIESNSTKHTKVLPIKKSAHFAFPRIDIRYNQDQDNKNFGVFGKHLKK